MLLQRERERETETERTGKGDRGKERVCILQNTSDNAEKIKSIIQAETTGPIYLTFLPSKKIFPYVKF